MENAITSLRKAVPIAPRFCGAYNVLGNCLDELGRYEEAIGKYEKVIELDPDHTEARFKRDLVLLKVRSGSNGNTVTADKVPQKKERFIIMTGRCPELQGPSGFLDATRKNKNVSESRALCVKNRMS